MVQQVGLAASNSHTCLFYSSASPHSTTQEQDCIRCERNHGFDQIGLELQYSLLAAVNGLCASVSICVSYSLVKSLVSRPLTI
jgi:hypothetical protein